ncbi:MAG: aspartate--ammonia ligase [Spirochaetes bacterium]|nr:aspartate--ammonia ligase [Spirochaetota bacterium]
MENLIIPKNYNPILSVRQTENAIKLIKDFFQINLASELKLRRVTAPLFVQSGLGINDDLNGIEKPVSFKIKNLSSDDGEVEIVQSLAKWKRLKLWELQIEAYNGLYTDMNAIRPDEIPDNIHSIYVDQWDWEMTINKEDRNIKFLKEIVKKIYSILPRTEFYIYEFYPEIKPILPDEIYFIHSEELLRMYPDLPPKEREKRITEKYKAVCIIGIGNKLSNGEPHDGRAADYDDWSTQNEDGYIGLNCDIIVWNDILRIPFEISSMGIRVDKYSLEKQLKIKGEEWKKELYFHKLIFEEKLPFSIGGGIGQSRLCMFFLRKAHIGEVQVGVWPKKMKEICYKNNIYIL